LNSQPCQYDQADQYQQNGPGYFPKLSQGWSVLIVKVIKRLSLLRKINTNDLHLINFSVPLTVLTTHLAAAVVWYIRKMIMKVGY
jgi:hypothetical protein